MRTQLGGTATRTDERTTAKSEKMWSQLAGLYDVMYASKDYAREAATIHRLIQRYKRSPGNRLLDVGCGTGGHLVHMKRHYQVVGADRNPKMLEIARRKCADVEFVVGDMAALDLGATFDVVTCLFGAINYARTYRRLRAALQCFTRHLRPGGVLILEPFANRRTYRLGRPHARYIDMPDVKIARMNISRKQGSIAILDYHFLVATRRGVRYVRDRHEMGLFDTHRVLDLMGRQGCKAEWLKDALRPDGGLYVGIKVNGR